MEDLKNKRNVQLNSDHSDGFFFTELEEEDLKYTARYKTSAESSLLSIYYIFYWLIHIFLNLISEMTGAMFKGSLASSGRQVIISL